jgi:preflagellin peptidase FlaK
MRTLLAFLMLSIGSYNDIRTREIHDIVWLVFGGAGLGLDLYELFLGSLSLTQLLVSVGFMSILMAVFGFFKLFGGADLLAFIALSLIHPRPPKYLFSYWGWGPPLFAFTLVSNTALVGIFTPFLILFRNLLSISTVDNFFQSLEGLPFWKKTILLFTGVYINSEAVKGVPFHYPLETREGEIRLRANIWDDEEAENVLFSLKKEKSRIWVSITLPYVAVMLGGYVLSVVFGDILLWLLILFING